MFKKTGKSGMLEHGSHRKGRSQSKNREKAN